MSDRTNLPVIIIDYSSAERTIKYIKDAKHYIKGFKLIFCVVDNSPQRRNFKRLRDYYGANDFPYEPNSTVGSVVKAESEDIYIIKTKKNLGYAKGNNLGFSFAKVAFEFHYVIFSNNDIRFKTNFNLENLLTPFDIDGVAVVGPRILMKDGKQQSPYKYVNIYDRWWKEQIFWPFSYFVPFLKRYCYKRSDDLCPIEQNDFVYRILGAFMVCREDYFTAVDGFDENTFLYAEESILSERLWAIGGKIYYCNDVTLLHEGGYTTKKKFSVYLKERQKFESELYYYKKYKDVPEIIIFLTRIWFEIYILKIRIVYKTWDLLSVGGKKI